MDTIKVSIVIPCLNVRTYIEECLESVIHQTLKEIEILCVDAFSTDGTREVIQKYQEIDERIHLLDDTMRSSGYADNLGISNAIGDYIAIVESDDYIQKDMMESLYSKAIENDLDYVKGSFRRFASIDGERIFFFEKSSMQELDIFDKVICPENYPKLLIRDGYMWKGIYKRKFIEKFKIKLNETKGAAYQDNGFLHQTICQAQRVMYLENPFYNYRTDNENSSFMNKKGLFMMLREYDFIDSFMRKLLVDQPSFGSAYYQKMFSMLQTQAKKVDVQAEGSLDEIWNEYKRFLRQGIDEKIIRQDEWGTQLMELEWFLEDSISYVLYLQRKEEFARKSAKEFVNVITEEDVVIIGAGYVGELTLALCKKNKIKVIAYGDNSKKLQHTEKFGIRVESVEEAVDNYKNATFIIANMKYKNDIFEQLISCGASRNKIRVINFDINPLLVLGLVK